MVDKLLFSPLDNFFNFISQNKERVRKFEMFVAENELKQHQALKKYEDALEQNNMKQRDIENLTEKLIHLRAR